MKDILILSLHMWPSLLCITLVFVYIFNLLPLKEISPIKPLENTFTIIFVFVLLFLFPLCWFYAMINASKGITLFYQDFFRRFAGYLWGGDFLRAVLFFLFYFFIHISGLIVPIGVLFWVLFGHPKFLSRLKNQNVIYNVSKDKVFEELKSLFLEAMRKAGLNLIPNFVTLDLSSDNNLWFSNCAIITRGRNKLFVLISKDFMNLYRNEEINRDEVKAIFLHEISHVVHRDHFFPLWAKQFTQSKLFFFTALSFLLAIFVSLLWVWKEFHVNPFLPPSFDVKFKLLVRLIILPLVLIFLFRCVIWQIIAKVLREREYLADARAGFLYSNPKLLIRAIRKSSFILGDQDGLLFSQAMYVKEAAIKVFAKVKKFIYQFVTGSIDWHPSASERIMAISQKMLTGQNTNVISSSSIIFSGLLMVAVWNFSILNFYESTKEVITIPAALAIMPEFMIISLVILNLLPLRLIREDTFKKELTGRDTSSSQILRIPYLFITGAIWRKIHLNNLFISIVSLLIIGGTGFTLLGLAKYFLFCTSVSILLIFTAGVGMD